MSDGPIFELKNGMSVQSDGSLQPIADAATRKLYAAVAPSIVKIDTPDSDGSGFVISSNGDVATDAHCILSEPSVDVITADGVKHHAHLVKLDDIDDIAVLHIDGGEKLHIPPLKFGNSEQLKPDQNVWAFGHPEGNDPVYVAPGYYRHCETAQDILNHEADSVQDKAKKILGAMTPKEKTEAEDSLMRPMFNARVNILHGSSGGPIVDGQGNVVGLNDYSNLKSDSDFTPVERLTALLNEKMPKFTFAHGVGKDGQTVITDISRTDGSYAPPFEDTLITGDDGKRKQPPSPSAKNDRDPDRYNRKYWM